MELVYTYPMENNKDMLKMMDEEFWKRLGPPCESARPWVGLRWHVYISRPVMSWQKMREAGLAALAKGILFLSE